ncbi:MAG: BolA/IbaG family iron-sulfur metabolism protein [Chromatiales bacterium]|jgi:acid stress-induced BolA-like protein IbaG/YrbA|nr:MAG: BolA/IbaG family iron-sulfur metabolism protein [Chromatiales bacterium]
MTPQEIATLILAHLPETTATVESTDNVHFEALVVSPAFAGKRTLQRHRLIYGALGTHIGGDIHALSIQAYTPEEWSARSTEPAA